MNNKTQNYPQMKIKLVTAFAAAAALTLTAHAATIVPITDFSGHGGGDQYASTIGSLFDYGPTDDPGTSPYVSNINQTSSDPVDWAYTDNKYNAEWYFHDLQDSGGAPNSGGNTTINDKMGWVAFDLGSNRSDLEDLYIFNNGSNNPVTGSYNVYYATSTTLPTAPAFNTYGSDIDFTSVATDWTLLASDTNTAKQEIDIFDLSSISARYIGIEIMTGLNQTGTENRVGFDEIAVTAVPEPTTTALLGLGGLALILRRRR